MRTKIFFLVLGLAGIWGGSVSTEPLQDLRKFLLEVHAAQMELLKIDWGKPGFCSKWDRDYDTKTHSCRDIPAINE